MATVTTNCRRRRHGINCRVARYSHGPARSDKAAGTGTGTGVARLARSRAWDVSCRFALYRGGAHRRVPGLHVAVGAIRGIAIGSVVHRPVGRGKAAGAGAGDGMA